MCVLADAPPVPGVKRMRAAALASARQRGRSRVEEDARREKGDIFSQKSLAHNPASIIVGSSSRRVLLAATSASFRLNFAIVFSC